MIPGSVTPSEYTDHKSSPCALSQNVCVSGSCRLLRCTAQCSKRTVAYLQHSRYKGKGSKGRRREGDDCRQWGSAKEVVCVGKASVGAEDRKRWSWKGGWWRWVGGLSGCPHPRFSSLRLHPSSCCCQVMFMTGWAPHESQPQPKARGSATVSFQVCVTRARR